MLERHTPEELDKLRRGLFEEAAKMRGIEAQMKEKEAHLRKITDEIAELQKKLAETMSLRPKEEHEVRRLKSDLARMKMEFGVHQGEMMRIERELRGTTQ